MTRRVVFTIYNFGQFRKIENQFLMGWVVNSAAHTTSGSRHSSKTRLRPTHQWHRAGDPTPRHGSTGPVSCRPTVTDVQDWDHPLLLSSAYKKEKASRSFLPHRRYSPNAEVRPTSAHRWLAADWPDHWAIPFAYMILTPLRSFCPRFRDNRSTTLTSTMNHTGDFCRRR
jgi:hypothetical protein